MAESVKNVAFTENTPNKYLLDAAAIYRNVAYDSVSKTFKGEPLGATSGGVEIAIEQEYRDVEVDGTYWTAVKGNKVVSKMTATANTTLKEMDAEVLRMAMNGQKTVISDGKEAPAGYTKIEAKRYVENTDYVDNIAMVGKITGSGQPMIVIFDNVLSTGGLTLGTEDGNEGTIPLALQAHASIEQLQNGALPWRIFMPNILGGTGAATAVKPTVEKTSAKQGEILSVTFTPTPATATVPETMILVSDKPNIVRVDTRSGLAYCLQPGTAAVTSVDTSGRLAQSTAVSITVT